MRFVTFAVALIAAPMLWGLDDPKEKSKSDKPPTLLDQVHKITQEYQNQVSEFYSKNQEKFKEAKTDDERKKLFDQMPKADSMVARLLKLAQDNPKEDEAVVEA